MQFDRGQARANPQRLSARVLCAARRGNHGAAPGVGLPRLSGRRSGARLRRPPANHIRVAVSFDRRANVRVCVLAPKLRSAQTTLNADASWRATARSACSSTVGTSSLRGRSASCARASSRNLWSTHCSIILRRLLLASRGSQPGLVGSAACHATRAGRAHARAARTGNGGDLPGTCRDTRTSCSH